MLFIKTLNITGNVMAVASRNDVNIRKKNYHLFFAETILHL